MPFKLISKILGIDNSIKYFLLGKLFSLFSTPLTVFLLATFYSSEVQGYYFFYSSLLSLSIFFELGLGVVITQFASHEFHYLHWGRYGAIAGNANSILRIITFLRQCLKWYALISITFSLLLIPSVLCYLLYKEELIFLKNGLPWVALVILFSVNTFFIPFISFIEGCSRIEDVQKLRIAQSIFSNIFLWIAILLHGNLYAIAAESLGSTFAILYFLNKNYKGLIDQLIYLDCSKLISGISWKTEVFPMQWRISITWISIYFINFIIIPISFSFFGAVETGKLGLSLKISTIVFTLCMAWVTTKSPKYGALIQGNKTNELDTLFKSSINQLLIIGLLLCFCVFLSLAFIKSFFPTYVNRILPISITLLLCLGNVGMALCSSLASYLRAHKVEPLMRITVLISIISSAIYYLCGRFLSVNYLAISYALIFLLLSLPLHSYIFVSMRRKWYA